MSIGETYLECEPEDYNSNVEDEVPTVMGYKKQSLDEKDALPQKSIYELVLDRWERFKNNPLYNVVVGIIIAMLLIKASKYVWDLKN